MSRKTAIVALMALAIGCEDRERGTVTEARRTAYETEESAPAQSAQQAQHPANTGGTASTSTGAAGSTGTTGSEGALGSTGAEQAQNEPAQIPEGTEQPAVDQPAEQAAAEPPMAQETSAQQARVVTRDAEGDLSSTVSRVQRELRANDFEVIEVVRYEQADRERAVQRRQQSELEASDAQRTEREGALAQRAEPSTEGAYMPGEEALIDSAAEPIGDVRLILYRNASMENDALSAGGIEALFEAPRQIAIFERGEGVVIAYQESVEGAPVLERIVAAVVTPTEQQASASAERMQGEPTWESGEVPEAGVPEEG